MTLLMIAYLIAAVRSVYRQSWIASSVKGLVLYAGYYLIFSSLTYGMLALAIWALVR